VSHTFGFLDFRLQFKQFALCLFFNFTLKVN